MIPLYFVQSDFQLTELFQIEIDAVIYTDQFTCYIGTWTSKRWSGVHLLHDNVSSHKCEVVKSFLASEKVKVLNHPPYSPGLSPCDFFSFPSLKKMLSGNKYTSRSSLGSAFFSVSPTDTKRRLFICFSRLGKKVTKVCFSKRGILWRFVIKICLIKRSSEVIRTQWQNFLQDPRRQGLHLLYTILFTLEVFKWSTIGLCKLYVNFIYFVYVFLFINKISLAFLGWYLKIDVWQQKCTHLRNCNKWNAPLHNLGCSK